MTLDAKNEICYLRLSRENDMEHASHRDCSKLAATFDMFEDEDTVKASASRAPVSRCTAICPDWGPQRT